MKRWITLKDGTLIYRGSYRQYLEDLGKEDSIEAWSDYLHAACLTYRQSDEGRRAYTAGELYSRRFDKGCWWSREANE